MNIETIRLTGVSLARPIRVACALALAASIAGCATTPGACDPTSRDFFKNTGCLASGSYGERQRAMQRTLDQEQRLNASFRSVLSELQAEQSKVKGDLSSRQADYARLDAAWGDLKRSLAAETKANRELAARVSAIDSSVQSRKAADAGTDVVAKQAARDDLKLKVSMLEKELAAGVYER
ncbi:MAG: hypothetical protein KFB96_03635 [Thiocapsa sp.]|uniref:hypothetical protein n=1 Tax=Thiocapsa sp. TaxID=2024551 RepID=UPI001BCEF020|nr:hypothetical protein [Thiocapsa sp.]QVL49609.1 MAG: hypothetical protein KFB96_03635 [Thiocapsa sp.]